MEVVKLHPDEKMKFYRELAVVTARFAAVATDESQKKSFDHIAIEWKRLAELAEAETMGGMRP